MRALALGGADLVVVPQAGAVDEWPDGLYEARCRSRRFRTATSSRSATASGEEECLTFAGESFVCAPDGAVIARAARMEEALLVTEIDLTAVPARTPGACSCSTAGRSCTPRGSESRSAGLRTTTCGFRL